MFFLKTSTHYSVHGVLQRLLVMVIHLLLSCHHSMVSTEIAYASSFEFLESTNAAILVLVF